MKRRIKITIAAISAAIFGAGCFFGGYFLRNITTPDYASLDFILRHYKKYYLEEDDDYVSLMANGLLSKDIYSQYYSKEDYAIIEKSAQGIRAGIGLTFTGGDLTVVEVKYNSPSDKAGITAGGVVVAVGKKDGGYLPVSDFNGFSVALDGYAAGEKFGLKIRYGEEEKEFSVSKEEYRETYVLYEDADGRYKFTDADGELGLNRISDPVFALADKTAYLKYVAFNGVGGGKYGSAYQVKTALGKFKAAGNTKLILDLRNNGGGYMDIMQAVVPHFIDAAAGSRPLVSLARFKDGSEQKFRSESVDYSSYGFEKIVILANDGTASASEAFIGAALDYDAKKIVSVVLEESDYYGAYRTYGKGIMQTTFENFATGEAIKLTTAKIYWPVSGECVHGAGITKNVERYSDRIFEAVKTEGDYALSFAREMD
ncbi:MAG TPA: hypothetical protein DDW54_03280 [Clostridiales bacterium]|nr:hypothetical protein [Clostridiales bacterium]